MRDGESADARGRRSAPPLPRAQSADRRAGQARQSRQGTVVFPRHLRLREPLRRDQPTARRSDDGRRPSPCRVHLKTRSGANSIGSNCCLITSRRPRPSATRCSPRHSPPRQRRQGGCCSNSRAHQPRIGRRQLWLEALFRHFDNRRQLASYAGLAPTPWQSGSSRSRFQGVSKAGNPAAIAEPA